MQPDPLSPPQEETQPEPVSPEQEVQLPEPVAVEAETQPQPVPEEAIKSEPSPIQEKKPPRKWNIAAIVLGVLAFIFLAGAAGLGFLAYTLNTRLATTQEQLTALQTKYEALTSSNETLNADLTQAKTDLEKANTELATSQADLKKAQDENKELKATISRAAKLAQIMHTWFMTDDASGIFKMDSQVKATSDTKLKSLWNKITSAQTPEQVAKQFDEFLLYLVTALRNELD